MTTNQNRPKIGFALGGGAARGWAHFGIIRALAERGIQPDVVCGTSIGALVGATYVTGKHIEFEQWTRKLRKRDIAALLDFTLGGGLIEGQRLMDFFVEQMGKDIQIENLDIPYASVATELATGNEIWFKHGPLLPAVRASISLPGLFTPVYINHKWLADGALVNPVPVSVCRALGAEFVIAIDLNTYLVGKPFRERKKKIEQQNNSNPDMKAWYEKIVDKMFENGEKDEPGFFDVLSSSINIMQDRITRSRMAGDPPDIMLRPDLSEIELMDFDKAELAIDKGIACVERMSHLFEPLP